MTDDRERAAGVPRRTARPRIDRHELMGREVNETLFQSATDTALALSRKELSSRELTDMLLTRIESVNPALNAVVELRREAALQEAVAADDATARGATPDRCTAYP